MKKLLPVLILLLSTVAVFAQCRPDEVKVKIVVKTDRAPNETQWSLKNVSTDAPLKNREFFPNSNTIYRDSICVKTGACLEFKIADLSGDGLCCGQGNGFYKLFVNDTLVAEGGAFGLSKKHYLNCPPAEICETAFVAAEGEMTTTGSPSTWYEFIPVESGRYIISTCFPENECNTTVWVYNRCDGLFFNQNNLGTVAFNEDFCDRQAEVAALFKANQTYFIRIGSSNNACGNNAIRWSLKFDGAVRGCTDRLACNFNPVAFEDDGSCLYPGNPDCPRGADLAIDATVLRRSLFRDEFENTDQCLRNEGCLKGYGNRVVARFDTKITNLGEQDFFLGEPPTDPSNANQTWEWDECHQHWHYEGYAEYLLFDEHGERTQAGFKNGFCVLDLECRRGAQEKYTCEFQGLSVNCSDIYDNDLPCQWLDITDLPAGKYTLVNRVNWNYEPDATGRYETNYSNNWAQVCLEIVRDSAFNYVGFEILSDCPTYVDCLGEVNGLAEKDCEGMCKGKRLTGDLNHDAAHDWQDVEAYLREIFAPAPVVGKCTDLDVDGAITVLDAALALDCALHRNTPGHPHTACEFPYSVSHPFDSVWMSVENVNPSEGYFDLWRLSPNAGFTGLDLKISGAEIAEARSLDPAFNGQFYNDRQRLVGLSPDQSPVRPNRDWQPLARIFTSNITDSLICVRPKPVFVNANSEKMNFIAATCGKVEISGIGEPVSEKPQVVLFPNPAKETVRIFIKNAGMTRLSAQIISLSGTVVQSLENVAADDLQFSVSDLPPGIFVVKIFHPTGVFAKKLAIK